MFCGSAAWTVGLSGSLSGSAATGAGAWREEAGSPAVALADAGSPAAALAEAGGWEPDAGSWKPAAESWYPHAASATPQANRRRARIDYINYPEVKDLRRRASAPVPAGTPGRARRRPPARAPRRGAARDRSLREGAGAGRASRARRAPRLRCTA